MANEIYERLKMRIDRESGMKDLAKTVETYGYVGGERFSFKDHEFQREIISDTSSRIAIRKCSQVGLSEVMVQKLLAMLAVMNHIRVIFTMPTDKLAIPFSKDRIDGAISQSSFYSGMVDIGNDSASQKKIGSCTLYVGGTFGSTSAISVPAEVVINDEVDFSNPIVLGQLSSRLRHAKLVDQFGQRGIRYMFSTPTVSGYGIDLEFDRGDQRYYMVKCKSCETWQNPTFEDDFLIPGLDKPLKDFNRDDTNNPSVKLGQTKILCPKCKNDLFSSLIDPERRQWVAKFSDRLEQRSYQVNPWDVPVYNTPAEIVRQMGQYPLKSDFYNFVLGLPYSDADNMFLTDDAYKALVRKAVLHPYMASIIQHNTIMGMDVGKKCHLSVGIPVGSTLHVIWTEVIDNSRHNPAAPQVLERYDFFKCALMVVDSGPDISLVNALTQSGRNIVACVYVREIKGPKLFVEKENEPVVNVDRTKSLTFLLKKHNTQEIMYPMDDAQTDEIFTHLKTTKKIRRQNPDGTFTELFTKTDKNDHWVHSLHYLMIAREMRYGMGAAGVEIPAPISVSGVRVSENSKAAEKEKELYKKFNIFG